LALVTYRNLLDEDTEFVYVDNPHFVHCAAEYARQQDDEIYDLVMKHKVVVYLNGEELPVDSWGTCLVKDQDEIVITPEIAGGRGGFIQLLLGVALIAIGIMAPQTLGLTAAMWKGVIMVGASMALGGAMQLLLQPDLPKLTAGGRETNTYNWTGIKSTAKYNSPIPVVYGTHKVGGNVISVFTETENSKDNYLYLLLALCEGEIDGIVQENDHTSVCSTSDKTSEDYKNPAIEINDQPLHNFQEVTWWYRTGTNDIGDTEDTRNEYYPFAQNRIPYFDSEKMQFDVGSAIGTKDDNEEVIYTTSKPVDMVKLQIKSPALYKYKDGEFIDESVYYKIEYKETTQDDDYYTEIQPQNLYTAVFEEDNSNSVKLLKQGSVPRFEDGYTTWIDRIPSSYTLKITNVTKETDQPWPYQTYWRIRYDYEVYEGDTTEGDILYSGEVEGRIQYDFDLIQYTTHIDDIIVRDYLVSLEVYTDDAIFKLIGASVYLYAEQSPTEYWVIRDNQRTGTWTTATIDFNNPDLGGETGRNVYDIRISRRDPATDAPTVANDLILKSVTEVNQGKYIYPNTALLGLRIKATGQLSGGIPNVVTLLRGQKIEVPSGFDDTAFEDVFWNDTSSQWEDADGNAVTAWDESTYTTAYSDNAMLCVRDVLISTRYGLGDYISESDLYDAGIIEAIKECHRVWQPYTKDLCDWWINGTDDTFVSRIETGDHTDLSTSERHVIFDGTTWTYTFRLGTYYKFVLGDKYTFSIDYSEMTQSNIFLEVAACSPNGQTYHLYSTEALMKDSEETVTFSVDNWQYSNINSIRIMVTSNPTGPFFSGNITQVSIAVETSRQHYHTYNGVLEGEQSALTALMEMCNAFRCWPVWFDGKFNFIIDKDETPVHTLTMGNIIKGSFKETFTPISNVPYKVIANYADAERDYELRNVIAKTSSNTIPKLNEITIGLKGITNFHRARREAIYNLNRATNCTQVVEFKCGLDALHATAGDIINFQHQLPGWGHGGRVLSYSDPNIEIDSAYTVPSTTATYLMKYQTDSNEFVTATIDSSGWSQNDEVTTVPLLSWPDNDPATDAVFTLGELNTYVKPIRLTAVERTDDDEISVVGVEHQTDVYTEASTIIIDDPIPPPYRPTVPKPTNINIVQLQGNRKGWVINAEVPVGEYYLPVSWISVSRSITTNDITGWVSLENISPPGNPITHTDPTLEWDEYYTFRFSCYCIDGWYGEPVTVEVLLSQPIYVPNPSELRLRNADPEGEHYFDDTTVTLEWNPVTMDDFEPSGDVFIKGYRVEIYHTDPTDTANILRDVMTTDAYYSYSVNDMLSDLAGTSREGNPYNTVYFIVHTVINGERESSGTTPFRAENLSPDRLQNINGDTLLGGARFYWDASGESDHKYYKYSYMLIQEDMKEIIRGVDDNPVSLFRTHSITWEADAEYNRIYIAADSIDPNNKFRDTKILNVSLLHGEVQLCSWTTWTDEEFEAAVYPITGVTINTSERQVEFDHSNSHRVAILLDTNLIRGETYTLEIVFEVPSGLFDYFDRKLWAAFAEFSMSDWSSYSNLDSNEFTYMLSESDVDNHGLHPQILFRVKDVDWYNNESPYIETDVTVSAEQKNLFRLVATSNGETSGDPTSLHDGIKDSGGLIFG